MSMQMLLLFSPFQSTETRDIPYEPVVQSERASEMLHSFFHLVFRLSVVQIFNIL